MHMGLPVEESSQAKFLLIKAPWIAIECTDGFVCSPQTLSPEYSLVSGILKNSINICEING